MKEQIKTGILVVVALLTLFNTYQIATMDTYGAAPSRVVAKKGNPKAQANKATPPTTAINADEKAKFDPINVDKVQLSSGPKTTVKFDNYEHDFGNIAQNSNNKFVYAFTNTGKEPLIITKAKGSCGCTVPRWPKEPIAPGEKGEIEIIYKPGKQKNRQSKTITITANTEPEKTILRVKANVIPANPASPAVN